MSNKEIISAIYADHGVEMVASGEYLVPSSDGNRRYAVCFVDSPEWMNPGVNTSSCQCPAGQHGKTCKHVNAVAAADDAVCAELGYE